MPPAGVTSRVHLEKDFIAIGRRFACCENVTTREDLERIVWRTGIIRAATELDTNHPDQQFCVEWDGRDPIRDYEWVYLHNTPPEDRYDNVNGGEFSCFLIEDRLMWSENDVPSNGTTTSSSGSSKTAKNHAAKTFRPAATFLALVDHLDYSARNRVPIRLLAENSLIFVDKDQLNAFPVQQHQTSLTIKGSVGVPVQKDHQIAINQWFDIRRSQQRLIRDKDKQLIGQSVQVYWKDGANQRWYSACLKGYNAKDQTVTVMDYNVIQDRKVDPRLEEIQIVKDYGRSTVPSTSPTPLDSGGRGGRSRRASTKSEASVKPERKKSVKKSAASRKNEAPLAKAKPGPKAAKGAEPPVKRPRGRPPAISKKKKAIPVKVVKPIKAKRKAVPASSSDDNDDEVDEEMEIDDDDDDEEELTLQAKPNVEASPSGTESDDDEPTWSLSKLSSKRSKGPTRTPASLKAPPAPPAAPPAKRKAKSPSPVQQNRLPLKKRQEKKEKQAEWESDEDKAISDDEDADHTSDHSASESEPRSHRKKVAPPKSAKARAGKSAPTPARGKSGRKGRKSTSESESPNRVVSSRPRKPPVSYREKSEASEEEDEQPVKPPVEKDVQKVQSIKVAEEKPVELVKPKPPAYNPLNVRKVKPRKQQPDKLATPSAASGGVVAAAAATAVESPRPVKDLSDSKLAPPPLQEPIIAALSGEKKKEHKELSRSPERAPNEALKNALAAPPVTQATMWNSEASKATPPTVTTASRPTPKKMARVAGQPQGVSTDFPRDVAEPGLHPDQPGFHQQQQHRGSGGERGVQNAFIPAAAPVVPPTLPSQPAALPPAVANPMDFFHAASQQQAARYPPQQFAQYPGYPPQQPQAATAQQQQAQQQQRHQQQQSASPTNNPSPFRATTPSPFVPRNSPVSNPQQQQQQQSQATSSQSPYRGGSNSTSQYSAPQSHQQQQQAQSHHMSSPQNYQPGSVIPGYGAPAGFYYPGHMAGGAGAFGTSSGGTIMYPGAGGGMYPLHLPQGAEGWNSLMYPMMAAPHASRAQTEELQRMAAAQAQAMAASNRAAAVRSTATSPDLRPSSTSNQLTGVITGAMQALNNFQIPSPPLGSGTPFGSYQNTAPNSGTGKHNAAPSSSSVSPAPVMTMLQTKDSHRPSSTHSNSSSSKASRTPEPSSAMRNSPSLMAQTAQGPQYPLLTQGYPMPMYAEPKGRERAKPAPKASKADTPKARAPKNAPEAAASEKSPRKRNSRKKAPVPEATPPTAVPTPPGPSAMPPVAMSSFAGEPCPLEMLSAIATSMMPVDVPVQPVAVAPPSLPEIAAQPVAEAAPPPASSTEPVAPSVGEVVATPLVADVPVGSPLVAAPVEDETVALPILSTSVPDAVTTALPDAGSVSEGEKSENTLQVEEAVVEQQATASPVESTPQQELPEPSQVGLPPSPPPPVVMPPKMDSPPDTMVIEMETIPVPEESVVEAEKPVVREEMSVSAQNGAPPGVVTSRLGAIVSYSSSDEEEEEEDSGRLRIDIVEETTIGEEKRVIPEVDPQSSLPEVVVVEAETETP